MTRSCGVPGNRCTLCCKLMPMSAAPDVRAKAKEIASELAERGLIEKDEFDKAMPDFEKSAGMRCKFQRHSKGCKVYESRPFGCRLWTCRWLTNDDTADLERPDRCHYVIDLTPDFVRRGDTGEAIPVVQIWCDPDYPLAHRDPKLREFLKRRWSEGYQAIVRYSERISLVIFYDGEKFYEHTTNLTMPKHNSFSDFIEAMGGEAKVKVYWE